MRAEDCSMKLVVVGTGYVGLVTGACLAAVGHAVTCVDSDRRKIEALQRLKMPISEPGLEGIVRGAMAAGRLDFSDQLRTAVNDAQAVFIAVGTPSRQYDGYTDRNFVFAAARELASALRDDAVVVVKSTVPVGTGDEVELIINELRPDRSVAVVSNPEFLRAGSAVADFMKPDRVVVGVDDSRAEDIHAADLRAVAPEAAAVVHEAPIFRADQVRRECTARHQDRADQRDGRPVRAGRCRRAGGRAWNGPGSAHRPFVSAARARLRRLLLPQGRTGPGPDG